VRLLVRLAEGGDATYFPARQVHLDAPVIRPPPSAPVAVSPTLEAELDAEVVVSLRPLPVSVRDRLLADPDSRERLRAVMLSERGPTWM